MIHFNLRWIRHCTPGVQMLHAISVTFSQVWIYWEGLGGAIFHKKEEKMTIDSNLSNTANT